MKVVLCPGSMKLPRLEEEGDGSVMPPVRVLLRGEVPVSAFQHKEFCFNANYMAGTGRSVFHSSVGRSD